MRFSLIQQDLNHVLEHLQPVTQAKRISIDENQKTISWYNRLPGINNNAYYPFEYQLNIDNQQYSILLIDGSFFQFFYKFDADEKLIAARLAYYPSPTVTTATADDLLEGAEKAADSENDILYQYLYNWTDILEVTGKYPVNTSHIRFDYDHHANSHEPAHIQFGGINDIRVPASFYPLPFAFVEMICHAMEGCGAISKHHLGHARNNSFALDAVEKLICINQG